MNTAKQDLRVIKREGAKGFKDGLHPFTNPYTDPIKHNAWLAGWVSAQKRAQKSK